MNYDEKLSIVERAVHEGLVKSPESDVLRSDSWVQVITPSARTPLKNGVFWAVLREEEANAKIASAIELYSSLNLPFWWIVSPSSAPADIEERLLRAGFALTHTAAGMAAEPARLELDRSAPEDVEAELVSEENLEEWLAVQAEGWSTPPPPIQLLRQEQRRRLRGEASPRIDMLFRVDGAPAGAGGLRLYQGFAHLFGGVVLPRYRRRGVFRAMVATRLESARARGIPGVTVHGLKDTSAPIFRRFGFDEVCDIKYYGYGY
jgi:GNAT superfamily N-acetyltransferase